jgi:monothiol glutaredoxin
MHIVVYMREGCPWGGSILGVLDKYALSPDVRDIEKSPETLAEMERKSGQKLAPCVEIDGIMLADTCGQEVEDYLLANELVKIGAQENSPAEGSVRGRRFSAGSVMNEPTRFF